MNHFKLTDLSTGMKLVMNDGDHYIVLVGVKHSYDSTKNIYVCPKKSSYSWGDIDSLDWTRVVEILKPQHPYDIFYDHAGWQSIWKKEAEKTEAQIKLEELQKIIEGAQQKIEQLKEEMN